MTMLASAKPVSPPIRNWLDAEVEEVSAIYRRLYPNHALQLVLFEGQDPNWSHPRVTEGLVRFTPEQLRANFLGQISYPGPHAGAPKVTVTLEIPRQPTPAEVTQNVAPWKPFARLGPLFRMAPMAYETVRYAAEMALKTRGARRHSSVPLARGEAMPVISKDPAERSGARPAILIGFHWLEVGGAEKLAFDCVTWALEAGLRVFVVASVPGIQRLAARLPDNPDLQFIRLDRYLPHDLWPAFVERLVLQENIRQVHIHHCTPLYESLPQLRVMAPWVKVIDSTHIIEYYNGGFPRISSVWSNFVDIHHVISRELVGFYEGRIGASGKIRLGRMLDGHDQPAEIRPVNLKAGQKTLHIASIGRMYYQKRPIIVVETLRALDRWARRNDVTLTGTLIGDGPFKAAVEQLLQRYELTGSITILPPDANVPELLQKSDILLLPSNNEGLALVCYEAIDHGCIPVSTDVGSQYEVVPESLRVGLAPYRSVRETVRAVDRLWRDPAFLAAQQAALHEGMSRLTSDPTAKEVLLPIYSEAAETTTPEAPSA